jgi:hypothetical protein
MPRGENYDQVCHIFIFVFIKNLQTYTASDNLQENHLSLYLEAMSRARDKKKYLYSPKQLSTLYGTVFYWLGWFESHILRLNRLHRKDYTIPNWLEKTFQEWKNYYEEKEWLSPDTHLSRNVFWLIYKNITDNDCKKTRWCWAIPEITEWLPTSHLKWVSDEEMIRLHEMTYSMRHFLFKKILSECSDLKVVFQKNENSLFFFRQALAFVHEIWKVLNVKMDLVFLAKQCYPTIQAIEKLCPNIEDSIEREFNVILHAVYTNWKNDSSKQWKPISVNKRIDTSKFEYRIDLDWKSTSSLRHPVQDCKKTCVKESSMWEKKTQYDDVYIWGIKRMIFSLSQTKDHLENIINNNLNPWIADKKIISFFQKLLRDDKTEADAAYIVEYLEVFIKLLHNRILLANKS